MPREVAQYTCEESSHRSNLQGSGGLAARGVHFGEKVLLGVSGLAMNLCPDQHRCFIGALGSTVYLASPLLDKHRLDSFLNRLRFERKSYL